MSKRDIDPRIVVGWIGILSALAVFWMTVFEFFF